MTAADAPTLAVTGAGGFLGGRLVQRLAAAGRPVRALVRTPVAWLDGVDQRTVELLDPVESVAESLDGADTVVHLAGPNEVAASADPEGVLAQSTAVARHVVEAAAKAGVARVVYVSTVHVYGDRLSPGATVDEDVAPSPRGAYAVSRLAVEHLVADAPDSVVLRLTNCVGAPAHPTVDRWTLVASDLSRQAVTTGELVLRSSGQQWRDFVAMDDFCAAVEHCATPGGPVPAGTYNLGSGAARTVRDVAELVQERVAVHTGGRPDLHTAPPTPDAPGAYTVAVDRLAATGWRAASPLADAVDELVAFCVRHEEDLR